MAQQVYISYSPQDQSFAESICADLESRGIGCWIASRDLEPELHWAEATKQALDTSLVMVVVFSTHTNAPTSVQKIEIDHAHRKKMPIIVIGIEKVEPSEDLLEIFKENHYIEASTPPFEEHLPEIYASVQQALEVKQPAIESSFKTIISGIVAILGMFISFLTNYLKYFIVVLVIMGVLLYYLGLINLQLFSRQEGIISEGLNLVPPEIMHVTASSVHPRGKLSDFKPANVIDNRADTAWCGGVQGKGKGKGQGKGQGQGQWCQLNFGRFFTVSKISIINGYAKPERFKEFNRAENITVRFSNMEERKIKLADDPEPQLFKFTPVTTSSVRIVIDSVYPGSVHGNTCLSEIQVIAFTKQEE